MIGKIISIDESAFGNDILTIEVSIDEWDFLEVYESRGFLNGQNGLILEIGDSVEFDCVWNSLAKTHYAKNIKKSA